MEIHIRQRDDGAYEYKASGDTDSIIACLERVKWAIIYNNFQLLEAKPKSNETEDTAIFDPKFAFGEQE